MIPEQTRQGIDAMSHPEQTWISGEEYEHERRRLLEAGHGDPFAPELVELRRRVQARNDYLFEKYGVPLIPHHEGKWVAISADGEVLIEEREVEAQRRGRERFGPGGFCLARLGDPPGRQFLSPRVRPAAK